MDNIKRDICDICHLMWQQGWVAANDGNVSVRIDDHVVCTPSGISKREMTPDILIVTDLSGNVLEGSRRPSTELAMHLKCYEMREDVTAVVHAHAPYATSFAAANRAIDNYALIETVLNLGAVPVAPYAAPGTQEVAESIAPFLPTHDAILLRAHGALTVGADLKTAYYHMDCLEHVAKIMLFAHQLGGAVELERHQIDALIERRESFYHLKGKHPGYIKY